MTFVSEAEHGTENVISYQGMCFALREPWTMESVIESARHSEEGKRPWLCRRGFHRREVIGDIFIPKDPMGASFVLLATTHVKDLARCKRCGVVQVRGLPYT